MASTPATRSLLPQVPSRRRCGGWRAAPRPARGTSRCSSRAAGRCCATTGRCATSGAGSCAGSCAAGTSPPAPSSGSPLPWGSAATSATCTSARTAPARCAPAPAPESCVSGQQLPAGLPQTRQVLSPHGDIRPLTGQDSKPHPAGVPAGTVASICLALLLFGILLLICGPPAYRWLMKKSRWRAPRSPPAPPICACHDARGIPRVWGHARAAPPRPQPGATTGRWCHSPCPHCPSAVPRGAGGGIRCTKARFTRRAAGPGGITGGGIIQGGRWGRRGAGSRRKRSWQRGEPAAPRGDAPGLTASPPVQSPRRSSGSGSAPRGSTRTVSGSSPRGGGQGVGFWVGARRRAGALASCHRVDSPGRR